jgi:hypothetical protein
MEKLFTLIVFIAMTLSIAAQSPQKMSYQAVVRNTSGVLMDNQAVGMKISILQGSATGTAVYVETQTTTTNSNGLVTLEIGGGTIVTGTFAGIDWSAGMYFIKTETDPTGGTSYSITGTSQLLSVPYALYAKTASSISGHYIGELYGGGIVVAIWKETGIEHGLIASLKDLSTSQKWTNVGMDYIGSTAQSLIDGQSNTNAIIAQSGHTTSAAKLCSDYINTNAGTGVYSDWYLPAYWELNQCYNAAFTINIVFGATYGFQCAKYWSSTEDPSNAQALKLAWSMNFTDGSISIDSKGALNGVRAVRRF